MNPRFVFLASLILLISSALSAGVPKKISYQGFLTTPGGSPVTDGTYQLNFALYDTGTGGSSLWAETHGTVDVGAGVFQVILGSVTPIDLPFDRTYYLEISILGGPGIGGTVTISPRSEMTSSPYAVRSDTAGYAIPVGTAGGDLAGQYPGPSIAVDAVTSEKILDATIQAGDIGPGQVVKSVNGKMDNVFISGSGGATVSSSGDSIIITAGAGGGGTGIQGVQNTNSTLDILNPNGPTATINLKNGAITTGFLGDNSVTPAKINTGGASSGQSLVFNGSTLGWAHAGAAVALPFNDSASSSGGMFIVKNTGSGPGIQGISNNDAVIGWSYGAAKSGIWGNNSAGGYGVAGSTGGTSTAGVWGSNSGSGAGVRGTSVSGFGLYGKTDGTNSSAIYGEAAAPAGFAFGVYGKSASDGGRGVYGWASSPTGINFGVVGESNSSTGVGVYGTAGTNGVGVWGLMGGYGRAGLFQVTNAANNIPGVLATHAGSGSAFSAVNSGTGNAGVFSISNASSNATALYVSTAGTGWAANFNGDVAMNTLQINGGSDMAEPFEVADEDGPAIEPGTVLMLDPEKPGKVLVNDAPYNSLVVGIASGAGGVRPGLTLRQEEVMDGSILVAIAGRVYCNAEASLNPIRPGDLLTTSAIPGYAMKAVDPDRSRGAVIGKALSGLQSGTGLVLVLVNLQ